MKINLCADPALVDGRCLRVRLKRGTLYVWWRGVLWERPDDRAQECRMCWRAGQCLDESPGAWCRR